MNHEKLKTHLLSKRWKKTTTFKVYPHSYSLDFEWESQDDFKACWEFINENGEPRVFYRRIYRYYKIGNFEYWAMHTHDGKGIINRHSIKGSE